MTTRSRRFIAAVLTVSMASVSVAQTTAVTAAPAALLSAEQVQQAAQPAGRALLERTLQRADVVAALEARGVSVQAARERVAALTDAEAAQVAAQIDAAPAGAGDVLGVIVFIFLVLLVTDILGFTKIFPFTRSIR
jgi:intracellular sulfur oxidation DsrE/DsrF family protein